MSDQPPRKLGETEKLELAAKPTRPKYVDPAPYRPVAPPGLPKWPLVLLLLVGGAVAAWRVPALHDAVVGLGLLPHPALEPIVITSEPSGATITIEGKAVGQTPWAGDNDWSGHPAYVLSLPGYEPIKGTFEGGQQVTLDVTLNKKR